MDVDLELYRRDIQIISNPPVRLSAIDISPEFPKRTILFLHGFGGQSLQWKYQLQQFSFENRVIALDLRGHGRSDKPSSSYSMEEIQADLRSAINSLNISDPFILIGHSFGGAVAAEFAFREPERIDKLILIATAGEFKLNIFFRFALNLPAFILGMVTPFTRKWLSAPPHVLKEWYKNNLSKWNGWEIFESIEVPSLIIRGHRDYVFEAPMFERVTQSLPQAEEVDIGASGHLVMLERHDALNRTIDRSLNVTPSSWREVAQTPTNNRWNKLQKARPWLSQYEKGVPFTICVPSVPVTHLLFSSVRRFSSNTALSYSAGKLTYKQLNREAIKFSNALLKLGLVKGNRVALVMPNIPQMVIAYWGTLISGCVAVFVPLTDQPNELIRQLKESDPSVLVTLNLWTGLAQRIHSETKIHHLILTDPAEYDNPINYIISSFRNRNLTLPTALHWADIVASETPQSPSIVNSQDDLAVIQFTGGTTAESKGVMLSHRNLVANAIQTRHWLPDAKEGMERFLCAIPFSHSYGLTATLNVPISIGATLILKPTLNTEKLLISIKKYRPSIFPGIPNLYVAINNFKNVRKYKLSSIRACISGSAPLPVEVQESFEKLTKGRLVEGYGLTEASPITHANPFGGQRKVGSIGVPLPSTEAKIVRLNSTTKTLKNGEIGELAIKGPQVMMGYWENPKATEKAISKDGWLFTGDVAVQDSDGFFRIIARKADMWYPDKPGIPAFPRDVEEVLYEIPQINEAAVVAIAGAPIAFVICKNEKLSSDSILAYCRRRLPGHLVPRFVLILDDFPRTFIGKVIRRELAKRYEQFQSN